MFQVRASFGRTHLACCALVASGAVLVGCDSSSSEPSEASVASTISVIESHPELEKLTSASLGSKSSKLKIPAEWIAPLADDENFFAAPLISQEILQSIEATPQHETVRLLGFANTAGGERRAIIKLGKSMHFMSEGDSLDGLELLEISERSIQLQRANDRWRLALLDQPIVNAGVAYKPPPRRTRPSLPAVSRGNGPAHPTTDTSPMPGGNFSMPEMPKIEMPAFPELPAMPELPNIGDLP